MCALMEKNRMFVMRNFKQEEPVLSSGYLCHFSDLEVKAAMLDDILKSPEEIKNISDFIESYECRSLRDTATISRRSVSKTQSTSLTRTRTRDCGNWLPRLRSTSSTFKLRRRRSWRSRTTTESSFWSGCATSTTSTSRKLRSAPTLIINFYFLIFHFNYNNYFYSLPFIYIIFFPFNFFSLNFNRHLIIK